MSAGLPRRVGMIGGDPQLAGWAARCLVHGVDVVGHDPDGKLWATLPAVLAAAEQAWRQLTMVPLPPPGRLVQVGAPGSALAEVDLVLVAPNPEPAESGPAELLRDLLPALPPTLPAALVGASAPPAGLVTLLAFDPIYLLPLVEFGEGRSARRLEAICRALGMEPRPSSAAARAVARQAYGPGLLAPLAEAGSVERRDAGLVALLQGLRAAGIGAGLTLRRHEQRLLDVLHARRPELEVAADAPLRLHATRVPADWIDYNGHLNESRYLQLFSDGSDALLAHVGFDAAYRATGRSFFAVETHLRHLRELHAGVAVLVESRVLGFDGKRLHLHQQLLRGEDDAVVATAEQMLLHVDSNAGRACPAEGPLRTRLARLAAAQAGLPVPAEVGRRIASVATG